jgi:rhomboid protease GluP
MYASNRTPNSPPYSPRKIRDDNPLVSYTLLGLTLAVFLLQTISQVVLGVDYPAALGMKVNELIIRGQFWRLITPVLLHGSILHLGFNMYALYILGPGLERQYGSSRFLALYLLSGFAGNVVSFQFSSAPSLGSSTAIFGLIGAQGIFLYQNREVFGPAAQKALMNVVIIAVINLVIGLQPGIDNWGHIGGLIGGVMFAWLGGPVYRVTGGSFFPSISDGRESTDSLRAGLAVFIIFAIMAGLKIIFALN